VEGLKTNKCRFFAALRMTRAFAALGMTRLVGFWHPARSQEKGERILLSLESRQARERQRELMEPYASLAWKCSRQSEHARSPVNLAALMAPEDRTCVHLQDSYLRRMWRLANRLAKVRERILQKKDVRKIRAKPLCV
jgi:hypothetical protein